MTWLADTRTSYDTVADNYADFTRTLLDRTPHERAALGVFADQVRAAGGGPVVDVGCGPGRISAYLRDLGLAPFGIDLSPAMIEVASREHPGLQFSVGSMTSLPLADDSVAGLVAWYSTIHIPDDELDAVLTQFRRVLRAGGPLLLAFHVGDGSELRTMGYGQPVNVYIHRRQPAALGDRLSRAGFTSDAYTVLTSAESPLGAMMFAQ
jgi:SAM-dependent methyltransferase